MFVQAVRIIMTMKDIGVRDGEHSFVIPPMTKDGGIWVLLFSISFSFIIKCE